MWLEIGRTLRAALNDWGTTLRFAVCVAVLSAAVIAVLETSTR